MIIRSAEELALLVQNYRKKQKSSQSDIGELVGLKQSTISAFESKPKATKLDTLFRILSAVNLAIEVRPQNAPGEKGSWPEEW